MTTPNGTRLISICGSSLSASLKQCTPDHDSPACPDCVAVDCERAHSSLHKCSTDLLYPRICERCGRLNCEEKLKRSEEC